MNTSTFVLLILNCILLTYGAKPDVSNAELQTIFDQLFQADVSGNRATEKQLTINPQSRTGLKDRTDRASKPYFEYVDDSLLEKPTYSSLIALYDDYNPATGVLDAMTNAKKADIKQFLDVVFKTAVFQMMREFLSKKGLQAASSDSAFRDLLYKVWFSPYSRARGVKDTSAFEHVFLGEFKKGETHGLHNWVRVYWLEKQGEVDYTGHLFRNDELAQIQFKYQDYWKSGGSFLLRSSPEFDFSMYTLCFLAKPGYKACKFTLFDCTKVMVTTHTNEQNGLKYLGTAYPQSERSDRSCSPKPMPKPDVQPAPAPKPKPKPPPPKQKEDEWPTLPPAPADPEPAKPATPAPFVPYKPKTIFKKMNPDKPRDKTGKEYTISGNWACTPATLVTGLCIMLSSYWCIVARRE